MSDVKRYDPVGAGHGVAWMEHESDGDYVTYDDHTALRARLAALEKAMRDAGDYIDKGRPQMAQSIIRNALDKAGKADD